MIFNNHESYLTIEAINYARKNGFIIMTISGHCSGKLQPLDVAVYKSRKTSYSRAKDSWMLAHPSIPVTIYDVAGIFNSASSMTPKNIISAFNVTGILSF